MPLLYLSTYYGRDPAERGPQSRARQPPRAARHAVAAQVHPADNLSPMLTLTLPYVSPNPDPSPSPDPNPNPNPNYEP